MHLNDILPLAAVAWSRVKPAGDPEFNNCALSHREKLIAEAEGVARTGAARTEFEKAFAGLLDEFKAAQNPAPAAATEETAAIESAPEAGDEESEEGEEGEAPAGEASAEGSATTTRSGRTRGKKSSKGH